MYPQNSTDPLAVVTVVKDVAVHGKLGLLLLQSDLKCLQKLQ